ncbi:unannotated protein [freshwater metagenome]|uniref:Unannotated protein n=1 Tax=freshwater metagenome TaxID=449393 RepID=A0A6J7XU43_9ZZZZ
MAREEPGHNTQVSRLLDLVPFLISHQGVSLQELAATFDVSISQITNDLNTLWMCGLPGYTPLELIDLDFDSGFVSISNAQILKNPRSLTSIEALSVLIGLELISQSAALENEQMRESISELSKKIARGMSTHVPIEVLPSVDVFIRKELEKAISTRSSLIVDYYSPTHDALTSREIAPLEIIFSKGFEYVSAFNLEPHGLRLFRVDRIHSVAPGHTPVALSLEAASAHGAPSIEVSVLVKKDARIAKERLGLTVDQVTQAQLHAIAIDVYSLNWVKRVVVASAGGIEIGEPQELRDLVRSQAETILSLYS